MLNELEEKLYVKRIEIDELIDKFSFKKTFYKGKKKFKKSLDIYSKRRLAVNHIRHNLTNYDELLLELRVSGFLRKKEQEKLKLIVFNKIKSVYPELKDEIIKQARNRGILLN